KKRSHLPGLAIFVDKVRNGPLLREEINRLRKVRLATGQFPSFAVNQLSTIPPIAKNQHTATDDDFPVQFHEELPGLVNIAFSIGAVSRVRRQTGLQG
ncbi:MAG: hypothetical protein PVJ71_05225, partial [Lysobacterales bacterium]